MPSTPAPQRQLILFLSLASISGCDARAPTESLDPWPFTVARVELACSAGRIYATAPDGMRYGVNGSAKGDAPDVVAILSRWDTSELIRRGGQLCSEPEQRVMLRPFRNKGTTPVSPRGTTRVGSGDLGGLELLSTDAASVAGRSPELSVTCAADSRYVYFGLMRGPTHAPPLRGVFATVTIDGDEPRRIEMGWMPEASWQPREAGAETALARALVGARGVTVSLPVRYAPSGRVRWTIAPTTSERARMRAACG